MKLTLKVISTVLNIAGICVMFYAWATYVGKPVARDIWFAVIVILGLTLNTVSLWQDLALPRAKKSWQIAQYRRMTLEEEKRIAELKTKQ